MTGTTVVVAAVLLTTSGAIRTAIRCVRRLLIDLVDEIDLLLVLGAPVLGQIVDQMYVLAFVLGLHLHRIVVQLHVEVACVVLQHDEVADLHEVLRLRYALDLHLCAFAQMLRDRLGQLAHDDAAVAAFDLHPQVIDLCAVRETSD